MIRLEEDSAREGEGTSRGKKRVWGNQERPFPPSPSFPVLEAGLDPSAEKTGNCCTEGCPCSFYG